MKISSGSKGLLKKLAKIITWAIVSIIALLLLVILIIQIPAVQRKIVREAEAYLEKTLKTNVNIGGVYLSFPKVIKVEELYVEDLQSDTLIYFTELDVDTDLWALLDNKIQLNKLVIDGLVGNLSRPASSKEFNYQFIIDAFSSDTTTNVDSTSAAWSFDLGTININNIKLTYEDESEKTFVYAGWASLTVDVDEFDLTESNFKVDKVELSQAMIDLKMLPESKAPANSDTPDSSEAFPFDLQIDRVAIDNSRLKFEDNSQQLDLNLGTLTITTDLIDLNSSKLGFESIVLNETAIDIISKNVSDSSDNNKASPQAIDTPSWEIDLQQLSMKNNTFLWNKGEGKKDALSFDPNHIFLQKLNAEIQDVKYSSSLINADLLALSLKEGDFNLLNSSTAFQMSDEKLTIENLKLQTNHSSISSSLQATFSENKEILGPGTELQLKIGDTHFGLEDLFYFMPDLKASLPPISSVDISADVSGSLAHLTVNKLNASILEQTSIAFTGDIHHALHPDSLSFTVEPLLLVSSRKNIKQLLPKGTVPDAIQIPSQLKVEMSGSGSLQSYQGDLKLNSSYGDIQLLIKEFLLQDSIPQYDINLSSQKFDFGKLIRQDSNFNHVNFALNLNGKGIDPNKMDTKADGHIAGVNFNNYEYDSIYLNSQFVNNLIDGKIASNDKALNFELDGELNPDSSGGYNYNISLDVEKLDLEALNFSLTPLVLSGKVVSKIHTADFKRFNGDLAVRKFEANNDLDTYKVDSLIFISIDQEGKTEISVDSDIMEGEFKGNIDLFTVADALKVHIDQYYDLKSLPEEDPGEMNFTFNLDLKNSDLLTNIIIPDLDEFEPGHIEAQFDSRKDLLMVDFNIDHMVYAGTTLDSIRLSASSNNARLKSTLKLAHVSTANIDVDNLKLEAGFSDNSLDTRFSILDSAEQLKYLIKGDFKSLTNAYQFHLNSDSLILAYENWQVQKDNYLQFEGKDISTNQMSLRNGNQRLDIALNDDADSSLQIHFGQFRLRTIGDALAKDSTFVSGILDGDINLSLPPQPFMVKADLRVNDFNYLAEKWGNITLKLNNEVDDRYHGLFTVKSGVNNLEVDGYYNPNDKNTIDAVVTIKKFDLSTVEPIVKENVSEISGNIEGQLKLTGKFAKPLLNGEIYFKDTKINPILLNNQLSLENEKVTIKNSTFQFKKFNITDKNNNTAVIDGKIKMEEVDFYNLDLQLVTNDFLLLNTTKEDNGLYYGKLKADGTIVIKGTSARPDIDVNMKVSEDSDITYVIPETEYTILNQENIVRFVSKKDVQVELAKNILKDSVDFQGINISSRIEVNDKATFNIIIDPITKDQLTVKGDADLILNIDPKGDIELSGRYTVSDGTYNFSFYKLLQREFNIEKGSSITWTGDPYNANLDLKAYNRVEAPPIDLLINQISNAGNEELTRYKQRIPFLVYLNIQGELLKPDISFEIDMPQDKRNAFSGAVYGKILDLNTRESDLNKQVFALLVLKRFISDDPLKSESGYNLEDNARRSVSRILSDQLNRLADNINGINLNLDLQSYQDFSSGEVQNTTNLELGVSKNLLDNRLEVKVSGNVRLEGEKQQSLSDYVGDLVLEYKLTEDGRLLITGFRRSDFDVISGQITETGTGIIYVRDYNSFKELFKKREKNE